MDSVPASVQPSTLSFPENGFAAISNPAFEFGSKPDYILETTANTGILHFVQDDDVRTSNCNDRSRSLTG
jgi:hypothetical protein